MTIDERAFAFVLGSLDDLAAADVAEEIGQSNRMRERVSYWRRQLAPLMPPPVEEVFENPVSWDEVEAVVFGQL
ncbi:MULTISPECIES: hypothetical protein [Donghicola]|jgi:anti-sigma-K factor RskA|uniref:Uncharacterized protein n=1 Tax=Donghicola eburneus TaxID=393278 RepID=A0A1M4N223_9RHOB|nr:MULTISPECIES: hypothetical protein [Donghicola]MCI5041893.1 hypothetical protein [Donghicola eburneus]MCT4577583.1 hypothetical protein [Donghicola sp.]SCM68088.1 hypothetical protein KARMA_2297 [Donghicola eburneus]SFQ51899.1 hypothetical protein SAMN05421764_10577 [Donghicola eburneus]